MVKVKDRRIVCGEQTLSQQARDHQRITAAHVPSSDGNVDRSVSSNQRQGNGPGAGALHVLQQAAACEATQCDRIDGGAPEVACVCP